MLEFENVSKSFWTGTQRKVILDKVSFRVELGNSLGILAPNGTGKTTLINMMAGLEKPDEGEIRRGCNISFPLGFMGGVVSKVSAMENARYIAKLDTERHFVQNHLALGSCPKGLTDIFKFKHRVYWDCPCGFGLILGLFRFVSCFACPSLAEVC